MLEEKALQFLADQAVAAADRTVEIDGITYSAADLKDPRKPTRIPTPLEVATLSALVDYIDLNEADVIMPIVHVVGPDTVEVISRLTGLDDAQRIVYCRAKTAIEGFPFGRWVTTEQFLTMVQSRFVDTPDRDRVLKLVGNIRDDLVRTETTDGVTQTVAVRAGISLAAEAKVANPFVLSPFRTFSEIGQPASPFILRVQKAAGGIEVSLHEADGGAWRLEAVKRVREWLGASKQSMAILA